MTRVRLLEDLDEVQAVTHPVRLQVLAALRRPDSAAGVARTIGQSRQAVNYHVKELERAGLIRSAGERRKGNFVEQLFESVASTFVVSPRLAWRGDEYHAAMRSQLSLEHLVVQGDRLQRDATALLDRAAFDGEEIPSAAVETEVRLADDDARAAFMRDYLKAVGPVLRKYGTRDGAAFRVALAVYPDPEEGQET